MEAADLRQRKPCTHAEAAHHQHRHALGQRGVGRVEKHQPAQRGDQPVIHVPEPGTHGQRQSAGQRRHKGQLPGTLAGLDGDQMTPFILENVADCHAEMGQFLQSSAVPRL